MTLIPKYVFVGLQLEKDEKKTLIFLLVDV